MEKSSERPVRFEFIAFDDCDCALMFDWAIWFTASLFLAVNVHRVDKEAFNKFWSWIDQHQKECIIECKFDLATSS